MILCTDLCFLMALYMSNNCPANILSSNFYFMVICITMTYNGIPKQNERKMIFTHEKTIIIPS